MLKFISLSSGSSGNCALLFDDDDVIMIDAGVGIRCIKRRAEEFGVPMSRLRCVLVTHDHADHVKAVGGVSVAYGVPVYATRSVHEGIERNVCVKKKIPAASVRTIEKGVSMQVGGLRITPFDVPHDSADNVGYMIECGGVTFCLITDVGHVTDVIREMIGRANYLVFESNHDEALLDAGPYPAYLKQRIAGGYGHISNRLCGETLAACVTGRLRHVWLCHLSAENNSPEIARDTVTAILAARGIAVGSDFTLDVLLRRRPSGVYEMR